MASKCRIPRSDIKSAPTGADLSNFILNNITPNLMEIASN
jgi:hypothetical protein